MKIDDRAWPLVITTSPPAPGPESIDTLVAYFDVCFQRRERFALVTDSRQVVTMPDAIWRKRLADWMNEPTFRQRSARYNVGSAVVLTSGPVRATLTAVTWLWKPPTPQHYCSSMDDAVAWCVGKLEAAGIAINAPIRALQASLRGDAREKA
jgi:hypothetical protein